MSIPVLFHVIRDRLTTDGPTMGQLIADGVTYQTLEPPWKDNAPRVSCIPPGTYPVILAWSPKFLRKMPLLGAVPDRSSILIHALNGVEETEGCIGIGLARAGKDQLAYGARVASDRFNAWLHGQTGPVSVEIHYGAESA
jgi:hypothetical protein